MRKVNIGNGQGMVKETNKSLTFLMILLARTDCNSQKKGRKSGLLLEQIMTYE